MIGNAEMYQTNKENPIVQYLNKAAMSFADIDVNQELKRQGYAKDEQPKQQQEIKQVGASSLSIGPKGLTTLSLLLLI